MNTIEGFGLAGYRSFGQNIQLIGPFEKINLFIGKNNSGKSNSLRFIQEHYENAFCAKSGRGSLKFENLDFHNRSEIKKMNFAYAVGNLEQFIDEISNPAILPHLSRITVD